MFHIQGIDHVALTVRDVARSTRWYQDVLGLERRYEAAWGDTPAVVCAGETCVALFAGPDSPDQHAHRQTNAMRHLAFRVDAHSFHRAQEVLRAHGVGFTEEDHGIAHSIYFADPDGHQLEITTYDVAP